MLNEATDPQEYPAMVDELNKIGWKLSAIYDDDGGTAEWAMEACEQINAVQQEVARRAFPNLPDEQLTVALIRSVEQGTPIVQAVHSLHAKSRAFPCGE